MMLYSVPVGPPVKWKFLLLNKLLKRIIVVLFFFFRGFWCAVNFWHIQRKEWDSSFCFNSFHLHSLKLCRRLPLPQIILIWLLMSLVEHSHAVYLSSWYRESCMSHWHESFLWFTSDYSVLFCQSEWKAWAVVLPFSWLIRISLIGCIVCFARSI